MTSSTHSPSQDQRGTARETLPAWQEINRLFERYGLPHPPTRLRDELVSHLKDSRDKARLEGERDKWKEVTNSYCERQEELHRRAQKAEAERDRLQAELNEAAGAHDYATQVEADLSALRARVAEVLEPFAREGRIIAEMQILPPEKGSPKAIFMAAADLHASLTGNDRP